MAEILIKATNATNSDPEKDRRGCYKIGMPVVVMDDGHIWGKEEGLPTFFVIKIPTITKEQVLKFIDPETQGVDANNVPITFRRRQWHISWNDLPQGAKTKLQTGVLTIKAGTYTGTYDYTWSQVKSYFKQITSGVSETMIL